MGYLKSSLIHPPYGEQKLGALVVLFNPTGSVSYMSPIHHVKHVGLTVEYNQILN